MELSSKFQTIYERLLGLSAENMSIDEYLMQSMLLGYALSHKSE